MSRPIGQGAVTLCSWGVKAGTTHPTFELNVCMGSCKTACVPLLTLTIPERLRDKCIKHYKIQAFTFLKFYISY